MSKRDLRLFIYDIKESIEAILSYVDGITLEVFIHDRKTYSAVIREFEIIGEATKHLPENLTQHYNEVAWRDVKDFRNLLIHEYFGIDHRIVWNTILYDLPKLKYNIEQIIIETQPKS
ncbi:MULTISPECIES: DUF86 domain-containing protein [unclassified Sulfurospirillum]|uniref:HepT-like ribonuclease domain-containing protein n=1 Tax=unclassified Sulfurospirillum TaxID=2618290 RepID=UPI0005055656|nr:MULTISPECIES: DUF86 domain-containing protein [unclassified Sulfurospirillum]KFL33343.1 hypothetical protein JU57_11930 [Sulfurospirillum sp. SCADC]